MSRLVNLGMVTLLMAASAVAVSGTAQAFPPPCSYTLSPPQVVQANGVNRVAATVTFDGRCLLGFRPAVSVACVYLAGPDSRGQCMQAREAAAAQVFFEPYQPGATYISSGRGCGKAFELATDGNCQILGPINATL